MKKVKIILAVILAATTITTFSCTRDDDSTNEGNQQQQEEHQGERSRYQDPKPLDYLLFGNLFHQPEILS